MIEKINFRIWKGQKFYILPSDNGNGWIIYDIKDNLYEW